MKNTNRHETRLDVNKNQDTHIRCDRRLHLLLTREAKRRRITLRELTDEALSGVITI